MSVNPNGLISIESSNDFATTLAKLESVIAAKELILFAKIDHAAGAQKIGKELAPTTLLIFGSPKAGTPLMECSQTFGIDLPLKILVWEDVGQTVRLSYNDLTYLAERHHVFECANIDLLNSVLENISRQAAE